jgi:hypothetical protein
MAEELSFSAKTYSAARIINMLDDRIKGRQKVRSPQVEQSPAQPADG